MATMEIARELGLALAASPEFLHLTQTRARVDASPCVSDLIREFQEKEQQIVSLVEGDDVNREDAVMLTKDIERIKEQLFANELFTELLQAQQSFSDLLSAVNHEINACIGVEESENGTVSAHCSGSCANCSGCSH